MNGLNSPIKRERMAKWILICCRQETHIRYKDTPQTENEEKGKIFHTTEDQNKVGIAIFISDKIDFKTKSVTRDKGGHLKRSIHQKI